MLYLAYGSNLNKDQMSRRCPKAIPLEGVVIEDWKLVFRGVADIEPSKGSMLSAGLWRITEDCEKALDSYEGYPHLYDKIYFNFDYNGKKEQVLCYQMRSTSIKMPYSVYYDTIYKGFLDFGLNTRFLEEVLEETRLNAHTEQSRLSRYW